MQFDTAINPITYEDRLRAIGAFFDRRGLREIRLELDHFGLTVAARHADTGPPEGITLRLTEDQVLTLCREARRRRGSGGTPIRQQRPSRLAILRFRELDPAPLSRWLALTQQAPYQELLRIIGGDLDRWQARACQIKETPTEFTIRVYSADEGGGTQQVYHLDKEILRARVTAAVRQRNYHQPGWPAGAGTPGTSG